MPRASFGDNKKGLPTLAGAERERNDQHRERGSSDAESGSVVVLQADDGRQDQQRNQVHHLDERVQGRSGGVLERVSDGVTNDRRTVSIAALSTMVTVFDVLLGVVPRSTGIGQVVGHQLADQNDCGQESTECVEVDAEADDHRREHGEQGRGGQLAKRRLGTDVDDWTVFGQLLALHDLAVSELLANFLNNNPSGPANGANGEGTEKEWHGATNEQPDEDLRVGNVDRQQVEHAAGVFQCLFDGVLRQDFSGCSFDEAGEQRHCGDHGRTDRKALGYGLGGVANSVETDHDALRLAVELTRHFGDTSGVVADRAEGVLRDDNAGGGQHAHAGESDKVERELQVAAAKHQRDTQGDGDSEHRVDRALHTACSTSEDHGCWASLGARGDFLDGAVMRGRVELGKAADQLCEHKADCDSTEALPSSGTLHVGQRQDQRADQGDRASHQEASVDGLQSVGFAFLGLHKEDANDRGQHANGTGCEWENQAESGVTADGLERRHAEDDGSNQGHFVALEEVGGHPGAVANVVTNVVGDGRWVAGIVLGNSCFDLADQVGADVGCFGEDAATDA